MRAGLLNRNLFSSLLIQSDNLKTPRRRRPRIPSVVSDKA